MQNICLSFNRSLWRLSLFLFFGLMLSILAYLPSQAQTTAVKSCSLSGDIVVLNGRKFSIPWCQTFQASQTHTFLSDIGAMQLLGLDLLSTNNLQLQPVNWFFHANSPRLELQTKLINPFRYLDVTEVLLSASAELKVTGQTLNLNTIPTEINDIWIGDYGSTQRLLVGLNRPTFWQLTQAKNQAILTLEGLAPPVLLERFGGKIADEEPITPQEELFNHNRDSDDTPLLVLESDQKITKLKINLTQGNRLSVTSLANPDRLLLDIRPSAIAERQILWSPGLIWHQKLIKLSNQVQFPVVWLEVDLKNSGISLRPITGDYNKLIGLAPLINTARTLQAIAAVNGGYFNRKTQQPLGAIRRYGEWLSGPILNRGAIAWDNLGRVKISRVSLEQSLITDNNKPLPIVLLNSGYTLKGMALYDKEWGATYTTLTDDEKIFVVKNNKITNIVTGGKTGENTVAIPSNGYLLTHRGNDLPAPNLAVGKTVKLQTKLLPNNLNDYPFIIGAGPVLLQNNKIVLDVTAEKFHPAFGKQTASRSGIAVTPQQKLIIAAVHNRVGGAAATLSELAKIMQALGAKDALNLDGGSSTSLYLGGNLIDRPKETAAKVNNGIGIFLALPKRK